MFGFGKKMPNHVGLAQQMKLKNDLTKAYQKGDMKKAREIHEKLNNFNKKKK